MICDPIVQQAVCSSLVASRSGAHLLSTRRIIFECQMDGASSIKFQIERLPGLAIAALPASGLSGFYDAGWQMHQTARIFVLVAMLTACLGGAAEPFNPEVT